MATVHGLHTYNRYIDLDYEDFIFPLYLRKRLDKWLSIGDIPHMLFSWHDMTMKSIAANALAKKLGMKMVVLEFNKEPRTKPMIKGERTLSELRKLLDTNTQNGHRKLFIIEFINKFPKERVSELAEIILNEKNHRFIIFTNHQHPLNEPLRFLPKIAIAFPLNHSPREKQAHIDHCKMLLSKYNIQRSEEELQAAVTKYGAGSHTWIALFGKGFFTPLVKELEFVDIIPKRKSKKVSLGDAK